jgi:hypothetical protein
MNKRKKMRKGKGEIGEVLETVNFIKDRMMTTSSGKEMEKRLSARMMTKSGGKEMEKRLSDKIDGVESKVEGIILSII